MNLSRNWLNEFVDLHDITDKQFNDEMTLSGSKVETIERLDESLKNVVAGKILSMEKHPDSDHMWVCQLDVGREEPVQIVTGAPNVTPASVGEICPVCLHKSTLPGGVKIEKGKLRGVESCGMLCSLKELGLTVHDFPYAIEDGIFILRAKACTEGVRVEVEDHGPGIAADDLPYIFDRYYRSRSDAGKQGTGLGLSITKAIFQQHGFRFGVQSAIGMGTTFWFIMNDLPANEKKPQD